jgi:methyl-accepting chemotaxis protein
MKVSLRLKILVLVLGLTITTAGVGIYYLHENFNAASEFISESSDSSRVLGDISLIEKDMGLFIQDWKNTLLRGWDPKMYEKYSGKFDSKYPALLKEADTLESHLPEEKRHLVQKFRDKLTFAYTKYKEARTLYINSKTYEPNKADKYVKGIDRNILDELRQLAKEEIEAAKIRETAMLSSMQERVKTAQWIVLAASGGMLALLVLFLTRVMGVLNRVIEDVQVVSSEVADASGEIAISSQKLSESSTEQAASLEETAASIEELTAMVGKNSENAQESLALASESVSSAKEGKKTVESMIESMNAINASNEQIAEIVSVIKEIDEKTSVINDIVFQTKLLSFNASVEAARAGEHGKGFSVVAEEVGNLAEMSGVAAEEISELLKGSVEKVDLIVKETKQKIDSGTEVASRCGEVLDKIVESISSVSGMANNIAGASQEQAVGIDEISRAVTQLDKVTQMNAAQSEESAGSAEELNGQSASLASLIETLTSTVQGGAVSQLPGKAGSPKLTAIVKQKLKSPKFDFKAEEEVDDEFDVSKWAG